MLLAVLAEIDLDAADLVALSSTPSAWAPRVLGGPPFPAAGPHTPLIYSIILTFCKKRKSLYMYSIFLQEIIT
jgi:hypothetical protein